MQRKSQIWVETAIYTLIGLTIISIILSLSLPQIEKMKDRETVKQTIVGLNRLNEKISEVREAPGSTRIFNLMISKGKIEIDPPNSTVVYKLENTRLQLGELGEKIKDGDVITETQKYGSRFNIILTLNVSRNTNLTYNNLDAKKTLQPGSTQYSIKIFNNGTIDSQKRYVVDLSI